MMDDSSLRSLDAALAPLRRAAFVASGALLIAAGVFYLRLWRGLAVPEAAPAARPALAFPAPAAPTALDWSAVRAAPGKRATPTGGLAGRFRLAGTFVVLAGGAEGEQELRKAIVDDLEQGGQLLVGEGERIGPVLVARVWADRIVLNANGEVVELRLSYLGGAGGASGPAETADPEAGREEPPLEVTRFGERIAEGRWRLSKTALNEYYREMLDHPERIGKLYETFEPLYVREPEGRRIEGYRLAIKGEEEFLRAAGLQEGDVVRAVNSLPMTSQSRAEFFIREFIQDRLDTVVLDIERDGKAEKLIYFMQ